MKKRMISVFVFACMICLLLAGCQPGQQGSGNSVSESRSGVVRVLTVDRYGNSYVGSAFGVGKPGETPVYFVTNHHVVSDEYGDAMVSLYILKDSHAISAAGLDLSRTIPCDIIYRDDNGAPDLAVIRAAEPVEGRTTLPLMKNVNSNLEAGETVYALGYPASADMTSNGLLGAVEDVTVTSGVVSRLAEYAPMENTRIIQHTASINGGNSGGPLITAGGAVVGINTQVFNGNGISGAEANHYASVQIEYAMNVLDDLGIDYTVYSSDSSDGIDPMMMGAIAAGVVVVIIIAVAMTRKPKTTAIPGQFVQAPYPGQVPVQPQAPFQAQSPYPGQAPVQPQTPFQAQAPVQPQAPFQPQAPIQVQAPVQAPAPVQAQTSVRAQAPVQVQAPVQAQAPVQVQSPVQAQAPVQAPAPVQAQAPVQVQSPVQAQAPVQVQAPVQAQTPVQVQVPVQPQAPVQATPAMAGDSGLRIQGVAGRYAGRRFAIAGQLRIGRDPSRNDLVYPADSQGVSGAHCVLIVEGGRLLLRDLGSTYGTFVGGSRLAANAPVELRVGDRFCLGSERETFVVARKGEV